MNNVSQQIRKAESAPLSAIMQNGESSQVSCHIK